MPTSFTTITASNIQDASGRKLASGRLIFYPVTAAQRPAGYNLGGGLGICRGVTFLVVDGAITSHVDGGSAKLADALQVDSQDVFGYRLRILDETDAEVQGQGFDFLQPTGASWSLDAYVPGGLLSSGGGGGGGDDGPTLVFASADGSLWRLARVSGALTAVPYSGDLPAQHLYLNDSEVPGNVFEVTVDDGGQVNWDLVTGHSGLDSVAVTDDETGAEAAFSIASGAEEWT